MTEQLLKKIGGQSVALAIIAVLLLCYSPNIVAQVHNGGSLHVESDAKFYVQSDVVSFGNSSSTTTSKLAPYASNSGKIMLGSSSSFSTDGTSTKFVNGYAGTYNTNATLLAIGASTIYAPIIVTAATNDVGTGKNVHAAYFNAAPYTAYSNSLDASVSEVANSEYWIAKGESAILSLSWRSSSNLSTFVYADVTIVGYKGGKWEAIPSAIDATSVFGGTSDLSGSGSITSTTSVDLADYDAFAIGEKGVTCFPVVIASSDTKTWNGSSWSPNAPTLQDAVVLSGNYNGGSFDCYSLNLGTYTVTLSTNESLQVVNDITGTGKIIISDNASLVQHLEGAQKPTIELTRTTRDMKRFDYVYWGSPVEENVFSQLSTNAIATGETTSGAFDLKYKYVSGSTATTGYGWQNLTATTPGQGFIMRVKEQAPFVDASTAESINLKFEGTANNGTIEIPVAKVSGNDTSARNNNLLANPYPSAIDAEKFLTENNNLVDGVIYLWRANTVNTTGTSQYTNADYIAYTKAGATAYTGVGSQVAFDGNIATGQGFKVRALASGDVKFTNCMRVVGDNSQFLRTNAFATTTVNDAAVNRFKLNLQTTSGITNQIVVAYLPETTLAYDYMYDARLLTTGSTHIFSILDNDTQKLAINARPDFTITDEVPLGFSKEANISDPMSIQIADTEGIFANNQTPVYLHDTLLDTYHNFANGAYNFNTTATLDVNRFKVVYQTSTLGDEDFIAPTVSAYIKDYKFSVTSSKEMATIQIFDITGRLVENYTVNNQKSMREDFNNAIAVYIAKITFTDGSMSTQKLINQL